MNLPYYRPRLHFAKQEASKAMHPSNRPLNLPSGAGVVILGCGHFMLGYNGQLTVIAIQLVFLYLLLLYMYIRLLKKY